MIPTVPSGNVPHLEKRGVVTQLMVDGKPFLVLGGELHNSSSSSVEYMKPVWPQLAAMHLNTVLLPVAWETIEPKEGKFDFSSVDGLLKGAHENNLKLVVLWFGAWKNTYSSYVPAWVKTNTERFPRVQMSNGRGTERLSPFSAVVRDADAHAFANLMRHIRDADESAHTVLMVQVENEVGVIPESRDHSPVANASFTAAVPSTLTSFLVKHQTALNPELRAAWETAGAKSAGTWQEVFGKTPLTDDLFMAWHYATYIDHIAAAGKAEYPIPMYANAALIRPNYEPGQYNSGGPLPDSLDRLSTFFPPTYTSMNSCSGQRGTHAQITRSSSPKHKVALQERPTHFTPSGIYRQSVSPRLASTSKAILRSTSWVSPIRTSTPTTTPWVTCMPNCPT